MNGRLAEPSVGHLLFGSAAISVMTEAVWGLVPLQD